MNKAVYMITSSVKYVNLIYLFYIDIKSSQNVNRVWHKVISINWQDKMLYVYKRWCNITILSFTWKNITMYFYFLLT